MFRVWLIILLISSIIYETISLHSRLYKGSTDDDMEIEKLKQSAISSGASPSKKPKDAIKSLFFQGDGAKKDVLSYRYLDISKNYIAVFSLTETEFTSEVQTPNSNSYLFTIELIMVELPCINKSFICTYRDLLREYSKMFPEIKFEIPEQIINYFGSSENAADKCLVLIYKKIENISNAYWICSENVRDIQSYQITLSEKIRNAYFELDFTQSLLYIIKDELITGIITFSRSKMSFQSKDNSVFEKNYSQLNLFGSPLFMRAELPSQLNNIIESDRCFQISELSGANHYFCINQWKDIAISKTQSAWNCLFISQIYNFKSLKSNIKDSQREIVKQLNPPTQSFFNAIDTIKYQVREDYLIDRHEQISKYKAGLITLPALEDNLKKSKDELISNNCFNIDNCIQSLKKLIENNQLNLSNVRSQWSMDPQNPYIAVAPKGKINEAKENLWKTLSANSVKSAFNQLKLIKKLGPNSNLELEKLKLNCSIEKRNGIENLNEKIFLMLLTQPYDPFMNYLSVIQSP